LGALNQYWFHLFYDSYWLFNLLHFKHIAFLCLFSAIRLWLCFISFHFFFLSLIFYHHHNKFCFIARHIQFIYIHSSRVCCTIIIFFFLFAFKLFNGKAWPPQNVLNLFSFFHLLLMIVYDGLTLLTIYYISTIGEKEKRKKCHYHENFHWVRCILENIFFLILWEIPVEWAYQSEKMKWNRREKILCNLFFFLSNLHWKVM
jgi:hypothetical protein